MGGIQAREGSIAEVHAVRGGQLILRVAASQTASGGQGQGSANSTASGSSKLNLVIPYEGHCYILDQSMDILEKIFLRLTPRELALLSLTCRTMKLIVGRFLEHYCASYGLRSKLRDFYDANRELLLPKELVLKDRLEVNSRPELLLYSSMRQFIGAVHRVSACEVDQFDFLNHKPSESELVRYGQQAFLNVGAMADRALLKERDVALKRDVVVLKKAPWVHFRHVFRDIPCGKYVAQVRMRLSNCKWDSTLRPSEPSVIRVSKVIRKRAANATGPISLTKSVVMEERVDASFWSRLEASQHSESISSNAAAVFDRDSDWFFLRLRPFEVSWGPHHSGAPKGDIELEFEDVRNPNWKQGVIWDFLELREQFKMLRVS